MSMLRLVSHLLIESNDSASSARITRETVGPEAAAGAPPMLMAAIDANAMARIATAERVVGRRGDRRT
ncbi:MAG: hypothetical protein O3A89_03880 [Actinomycetota bacterium]|nr:hypothetical protein [Actinomycetota bacterium]